MASKGNEEERLLVCKECGKEIVEGQHYINVMVKTDTRMPDDWVPVRDIKFAPEIEGPFCSPIHLVLAVIDSPELRDTFAR